MAYDEWLDSRVGALLPKGGVLVDLGCGNGSALDSLSHSFQEAIGLDVESFDQRAARASAGGWRFIEADLNEPFPIQSDYATAVLANQVIEHVADPSHFVSETYRILAAGGVVVIATPNIRYIRHLIRLSVLGHGPSTACGHGDGPWDGGHVHYFTHTDLAELLAAHGFRRIRSQALVELGDGGVLRRMLDRVGSFGVVREFMSGNALVSAQK